MRILFFGERLAPPFDEGIKNLALNLLRQWRGQHEVLALTTEGADLPDAGVRNLAGLNRLLSDAALRDAIRAFGPQRIVYLPTASMTWPAFLRAWMLGRHGRGAPVTLIALQPRRQRAWQRLLTPAIAPARVIVQSRQSAALLAYLGERVRFVSAGVDMERFAPATPAEKLRLRQRYGIDAASRVLAHAGHINRRRNVSVLAELQGLPGVQTILAGSTSTPQDSVLVAELQAAGVRVITEYLPHIEEFYRLADLYLFPARPDMPAEDTPAIEVPLSVLEALACDLPVVTTRFGGLPALFEGMADSPVHFVEGATDAEAWRAGVAKALAAGGRGARRLAARFSWQRLADAAIAG